jgi:hypothetical protein
VVKDLVLVWLKSSSAICDTAVEMVERSVVAFWLPKLDFDLHDCSESESTLLNLDLLSRVFGFLLVLPWPLRNVAMALLRTVIMLFFDLKPAGLSLVMKTRPEFLFSSSLLNSGEQCDVSHTDLPRCTC